MDTMTTHGRLPIRLLACLLLLAGCSGAAHASADDAAATRKATSSHLTNNSSTPIAYDVDKPSDPDETLAPNGGDIVGPGGAWRVPYGWSCAWHNGDSGDAGHPITVTAGQNDQWTTFTGYYEVIDSCQPLGR